eukprot:6514072-Prymnesium_polylepis.2
MFLSADGARVRAPQRERPALLPHSRCVQGRAPAGAQGLSRDCAGVVSVQRAFAGAHGQGAWRARLLLPIVVGHADDDRGVPRPARGS